MRILIADDEPQVLEAFALSLTNHQVTTCNDAETCLMQYFHASYESGSTGENKNPYDLVILDHRLRDHNGVEVAKEIMTMNPSQRIIIITGWPVDYLDTQGLKLKVLQKPIDPETLLKSVNEFLEQEKVMNG